MGTYLSQPKTDKVSKDESNEYVVVGSSSMQGWRNSQEDAHNAILEFDAKTSFFAVYDGHGGAEVATYCADKLPQFLKELAQYTEGNLEEALKQAFLKFDLTLLNADVIDILKILAGEKNFDSDGCEDEEVGEDLVELHEESRLPLDELMEKYRGHPSLAALNKIKEASGSSGPKPQSPYLRGRRTAAIVAEATNKNIIDAESKPVGSSTSKLALAALNDDGPSSSKIANSSDSSKRNSDDDSTVSSSSAASAIVPVNNIGAGEGKPTIKVDETIEAEAAGFSVANGPKQEQVINSSDSLQAKGGEQNGSVTSSETKATVTESAEPKSDARITSSDATEDESKSNGAVQSAKTASTATIKSDGGISSTSKGGKKLHKIGLDDDDDDTDDDYHVENAHEKDVSSEEEEDCADDEDDEDEDMEQDESDEFDSEPGTDEYEDDEEEDADSTLDADQFCTNWVEEPGKDSGCTAVVALLKGRDLYVANAGDSRCVVCRNGKAIEMSLDHKPEDDEECARIINAGGRVTMDGRVNGGLNLSRAIGDHAYKMNASLPPEEQMISALPDIKKLIIMPEDEFMILACDGIWNFLSSDEVVEFVRHRLADETKTMSKICEELFEQCLAPDTLGDGTGCDNMTAVIVRFTPKILTLPTTIKADETEDVLLAKKQAEKKENGTKNNGRQEKAVTSKALKRLASPTESDDDDDEDSNEAEQANKTKRLKTDADTGPDAENMRNHSLPSISSCHSTLSSYDIEDKEGQQECDSLSSPIKTTDSDSTKTNCTKENLAQPEATATTATATTATTKTVSST